MTPNNRSLRRPTLKHREPASSVADTSCLAGKTAIKHNEKIHRDALRPTEPTNSVTLDDIAQIGPGLHRGVAVVDYRASPRAEIKRNERYQALRGNIPLQTWVKRGGGGGGGEGRHDGRDDQRPLSDDRCVETVKDLSRWQIFRFHILKGDADRWPYED